MTSHFFRLSASTGRVRCIFLMLAALLLSGCSMNQLFTPVYKVTGVVLKNYSESEATPYVMQMSDPAMACALGEAIDPLLYSFSRVVDAPKETGSLMMLLAANCTEEEAWEADLRYRVYEYAGAVSQAKDARERAKRLNALVAKRRYESFQRAMAAYEYDPAAENAECPFLYDEQDEITFLLGLLTGMQSIVNDANSGALAGVPRDIAAQAERAAECVDNEKWAGLPNAIRGLVWLLLPDTRPELSPDPWEVLENSSRLGVEKGIRASMALEAVAAETFGRDDVLEDVLARFAASEENFEVWEEYRVVDEVARNVVTYSSDKYWASNYGYRTPSTYFGKLSDQRDMDDVETMDLDGLL